MADQFNYSAADVEIAPPAPPPISLSSADVEFESPKHPDPVRPYGQPAAHLPGAQTPFGLTERHNVPSGFGGDLVTPANDTSKPVPAPIPSPDLAAASQRLSNNPPGVPKAPIPAGLQTPGQLANEQRAAGSPSFTNPRTGAKSYTVGTGGGGPLSVLDAPVTGYGHTAEGVEQMTRPGLKEKAAGAAKALGGAMEMASPLMVGTGIAAPLETATVLGGAAATEGLTKYGLEDLGVDPAYADLAGSIAGIVAGYAVHAGIQPPEVQALVEASKSAGPTGDYAVDADLIDKLTRMASQTQSPNEAATARAMLFKKYGINIPEQPVAEAPLPAEPVKPPPPRYNSQEFMKAHDLWNKATNKAATDFMEQNPGVSYDDAKEAVAGTVGVEPTIDNYKAPPPPPEPPPVEKPVPPPKVQKVSPATPNAPTAAALTTPESPETMAIQLQQMGKFGEPVTGSQRKAVMFPGGQGMPDLSTMAGLKITHDEFGNVYAYRPDLIDPSEIRRAAKTNTLTEVLGGPMGMGAPDKANLQGDPIAVVAKGPDGAEAQTTVTDAANLPQTVAATHAVKPEGGTVEVKSPDQALGDRAGNPDEDFENNPVEYASHRYRPGSAVRNQIDVALSRNNAAGYGLLADYLDHVAKIDGDHFAANTALQIRSTLLPRLQSGEVIPSNPQVGTSNTPALSPEPGAPVIPPPPDGFDLDKPPAHPWGDSNPTPPYDREIAGQINPSVAKLTTPRGEVQIFSIDHADQDVPGQHFLVAVSKGANAQTGPGTMAKRLAVGKLAPLGFQPSDIVGTADIVPNNDLKGYHSEGTYVDPAWQRNRIASTMYDHAESIIGEKLHPAGVRTTDGDALQQSRQTLEAVDNSADIRRHIERGKELQEQAKTDKSPIRRKKLLAAATEEFNKASALNDQKKPAKKPVTPQLPAGVSGATPLGFGPQSINQEGIDNLTPEQLDQVAAMFEPKPLTARESSSAAKKLGIDTSKYDLKTIDGRKQLAAAIHEARKFTNVDKADQAETGVPLDRGTESTEPTSEPTTVQRPGQEDIRTLGESSPEVRPEPAVEGPVGQYSGGGSAATRGDVQPEPTERPGGGSGGRNSPRTVEPSGEPAGGRITGDLTRQTEGGDFRIAPADHIGEGTQRQKLNDNLEAIRLVKKLEKEERPATPEEQEKLAKYVGWGGLWQIFDWGKREWGGAREELNALLTPEEYKAAQASTKNAHFTSPEVITSMWNALKQFGVQPGFRVLEPSMGIGSFFGLQPDALMPARRTGVELDKITGAMAKALYPDSNVQITGFEKMSLPNDFFDVAIGNVPFGNYPVYDPQYKRNRIATSAIHNYFFLKSLDLVRPGGIVGFVTSRYTMDAQDTALRELLASKADLVGMMRLPNTAFKGNAGTEVVTDIIFLRKRPEGEAPSGPSFTETREVSTANGEKTLVNEYYAEHPEMMLGSLTTEGSMYGANQQTLEGKLTPEVLQSAVDRLPRDIYSEWKADTPAFEGGNDFVQLGDEVKDGGYSVKDGVLVQREGNIYKPAITSDKSAPRIRAFIPVRGALRKVFETQLADAPEKDILAARDNLNRTYDAFVKTHGALSSKENARALGDDPDYVPLSGALENYDRETKKAEKTHIFSERTVEKPSLPTHADTANEALAMVLNERGRLDWNRMQELTGKTPDDIREELGDQVFQNPDGQRWETQDEYLSGNVRKKLDIAKKAATIDPQFNRNVTALERVQPEDLRPDEIKITPGAPWIPAETVQEFVRRTLGLRSAKVYYSPAAATWSIDASKHERNAVANNETYGTEHYFGHELFDLALNGKSPRVYRDGPNDTRIFDPQATAVSQAAMDSLKDKFREWVWDEPKRSEMLAAKYNKEVNNLRHVDHDGSFLTLPGSNPGIILRPHQKNVIWRALKTGNTLLAHEVGAGKTWEMTGIAMESRRLGISKKPMIAVPNHMAEQFSKEFLQLYPAARILTIGKEDFAVPNRTRAVARIAGGNWDAVIIRHSSFEKIPVSDETYQAFVDNQVAELKAALAEQRAETGSTDKKKDKTVKEIEKAISRLEVKLQKHLNREDKDTGVTFEQLGVDLLMVDEAHAFKALPIVTRRTRVAGIPTRESNRATDMYMKTQYVTKLNGGRRGVIFATGTPVTNTMAELYNMQRYLQGPALYDAGIQHFDSWANMFGDVRTGVELDVSGKGFRENTRFAKFINIPELMKMYMQVADVKTAEMMQLPRPELVTGAPIAITGAGSAELTAYVDHLIDRAEAIRGGNVNKRVDNMLNVVSEGKKAALDMRLVDPQARDLPTSKVNRTVATIIRHWRDTADTRATQIVFCDLSVPLSAKSKKKKAPVPQDVEAEDDLTAVPEAAGERAGFSVYDDMRRKLINAGIPSKEIAFIHDYPSDEQKQELFDSVNAGRVRVLFGSTQKIGVGTNVQKRGIALYNMDAPWMPADIKQRIGRIQRQGNMHNAVYVYQGITEGSFDAYSWQLLENKAAFIAPIQAGDTTIREMEDVGMMLPSAAEFKAMASGNPLIKEKIGTDSELAKLEAQRGAFRRQQAGIKHDIANLPSKIANLKKSIDKEQANVDFVEAHKDEGFTVGGKHFEGKDARKEAAAAIHEALLSLRDETKGQIIGTYNGLELSSSPQGYSREGAWAQSEEGRKALYPALIIRTPDGNWHSISVNQDSPISAIRSIEGVVSNIDVPRWMPRELEEAETKLKQLQPLLDRTWPHEKRFADLVKRKAEIDTMLDQSEAEKSAAAEDGDEVEQAIPKGASYQDRKRILLARERGEDVEYVSSAGTAQTEKIQKQPAAPKLPKGVGLMANYVATNEPVDTPENGWYKQTVDGKNYYSDGHAIIEGEAPAGESRNADIAQYIKDHPGEIETQPKAFAVEARAKGSQVEPRTLVVFGSKTALDAKYYDYVKERFPDAKPFVGDNKNAVSFKQDGRTVAYVMGMRPETIPDSVKSLLADKSFITLGSGFGALQPGYEAVSKAAAQFIREDALPKVAKILHGSNNLIGAMVDMVNPRRGVPTKTLDQIYRMNGGREAANYLLANQLDKWSGIVDKMTRDEQVDFIDRQKTGQEQSTESLQDLSEFLRKMDDALYTEISKYSPSTEYLENHYRVLWKVIPGSPEAKAKGFSGIFRRPLQGGKGFLKQHTLNDMSEGIALGGVPYTYNPIKMFQSHYADTMKYITARRMWDEFKKTGVRKFVRFGTQPPEGFVKLDDSIAKSYFSVPQGVVDPGEWYVEKGAAHLLNNMLGRDYLREVYADTPVSGVTGNLGRTLLSIKNATTAVELSLSPFHAVFEALEAVGSQVGIGTREMWNLGVRGTEHTRTVQTASGTTTITTRKMNPKMIAKGIADIVTAPKAAVTAAKLGSEAKHSFGNIEEMKKTVAGRKWLASNPDVEENMPYFFLGGGKINMPEEFQIRADNGFKEYWNSARAGGNPGHYISAAVRSLPAANKFIMKPLFEMYIPNLKIGFFLKEFALAKQEYADRLLSGEMTLEQLARQVVDSVENRFGEMNFDNLFWNRTFKTAAQILFRSVTWKLGNTRATGGAFTGQAEELKRAIKTGKLPMLHPNMGWLLGMIIGTVVLGSVIHMAATGKKPETMKDVIYPVIDPKAGIRVSLPTYLRDIAHLKHSPGGYVKSSLSGDIGKVADIWENKDFYGNEVYNPDDNPAHKAFDIATHFTPTPFTLSSKRQATQEGGSNVAKYAGFLGFTKAPRYIEQTDAQQMASDYAAQHREVGNRTAFEADKAKSRSAISNIFRRGGDPKQEIAEAEKNGLVTPHDIVTLQRNAKLPQLVLQVRALSMPEAIRVYNVATPEERGQIKREVNNKVFTARSRPGQFGKQGSETWILVNKYFPAGLPRAVVHPPVPQIGSPTAY